ncbi:MAG: hypothetical protein LKI04_13110 [Paenibacillus lautus]|uniref:hypothetical protein n=1 Tax=Paenibacillus lautus TaxID=1401 RepID=UPI0026ECFE23|nr:hypothetical protein [Paenibacillus lautus]MCI1774940.1 hypothetical protein [Paenibacillus lautus]
MRDSAISILLSDVTLRWNGGRVIAAITGGCIDIAVYITHRSSLEDMIDRFDSWLLPESKVIKALVELN